MANTTATVCGKSVQIDRSGVGHCWKNISSISEDVAEIIAGEIIDGGISSGKTCIGGVWYRWC